MIMVVVMIIMIIMIMMVVMVMMVMIITITTTMMQKNVWNVTDPAYSTAAMFPRCLSLPPPPQLHQCSSSKIPQKSLKTGHNLHSRSSCQVSAGDHLSPTGTGHHHRHSECARRPKMRTRPDGLLLLLSTLRPPLVWFLLIRRRIHKRWSTRGFLSKRAS